jgi:hypothetical protein
MVVRFNQCIHAQLEIWEEMETPISSASVLPNSESSIFLEKMLSNLINIISREWENNQHARIFCWRGNLGLPGIAR